MRNVLLTFVIFAFLAPVGSVWGQNMAVVTFTNPDEALAYNELVRKCKRVKDTASAFSVGKYGYEKELVIKRKNEKWRFKPNKDDILWVRTIAEMIFDEKKSPNDVYLNCMMKGKALHPYDKRRINNIMAGKISAD